VRNNWAVYPAHVQVMHTVVDRLTVPYRCSVGVSEQALRTVMYKLLIKMLICGNNVALCCLSCVWLKG
jgi:hypothetical protein